MNRVTFPNGTVREIKHPPRRPGRTMRNEPPVTYNVIPPQYADLGLEPPITVRSGVSRAIRWYDRLWWKLFGKE